MKQFISYLCVFILLHSFSISTLAGDIPEALSYNDDAKVFIGTLLNISNAVIENSSGEKEVTVLPTLKIKGEVEVGVTDSYEWCYFPRATPKKGAEYFLVGSTIMRFMHMK